MDPNTEIRKLRPAELYTLARILAASDSWKTLMAVVPKEGTENEPKFNTEHFALIEQASCQQRKSGAEIFLEEWSTMGKRRPTLTSMLDLLVRVDLFRAADYIAVDLLQKQPPARPTCGPAAPIDISDEEIAKLMKRRSSEFEFPDSRNLDSEESLVSVLNGIEYPSQLSIPNLIEPHVEQNHLPRTQQRLEFIDQMSMLRIHPEEINQINSNLMQFSKSDAQSHQNINNSNLMRFSSSSVLSTATVDSERHFGLPNTDLHRNSEFILQRQSITCTSSSDDVTGEENIYVQKNITRVSNTSDTNERLDSGSNNNYFSDSNNCSKFELESSELPAFVADMGRGSTSTYSELRSSELPQFVVEIAHDRTNESDSQANIEAASEPTLLTRTTLSNNSTNFSSLSNNNTESYIPNCINFSLRSLGGNELVSADLPQFVADLGHRQNNYSSSNCINNASELADESSNEPFMNQFAHRNVSTDQYIPSVSQELPLVVSECNKMHSQGKMNQRELESAELPQFVVEL